MFFLRKPSAAAIAKFLARQQSSTLSYPAGITLDPPRSYFVDRQAIPIGNRPTDFAAARAALFAWRMFPPAWTAVHSGGQAARVGLTVAVAIRHLGFWSLNGARVLYEVDQPDRAGFAYGTLHDHGERGEEFFSVTMDASGAVRYELLAVSRPGSLLSWLGLAYVRRLQARFRRESARAMQSLLTEV